MGEHCFAMETLILSLSITQLPLEFSGRCISYTIISCKLAFAGATQNKFINLFVTYHQLVIRIQHFPFRCTATAMQEMMSQSPPHIHIPDVCRSRSFLVVHLNVHTNVHGAPYRKVTHRMGDWSSCDMHHHQKVTQLCKFHRTFSS